MGISLWLMPKPGSPLHDALQSTIDGLQPLFDDAPRFAPHVTITGNIEINSQKQVDWILDRALMAAKAVPHINVVVDKVGYGATFTHKIFFEVEKQTELLSLAQLSREEFVSLPKKTLQEKNYNALSDEDLKRLEDQAAQEAHDWVNNEFAPHLSLVYSNTYPIDEGTKQMIDQRLEDVFGVGFEQRGLGWTNGRLQLVRCDGPIEQWPVLGYRDIP